VLGPWGGALGPQPPTPKPQSPIPNPHLFYLFYLKKIKHKIL